MFSKYKANSLSDGTIKEKCDVGWEIMLKIVFFSIPLFGHVNYGLKLAKALCDNDHNVRYYSGKTYERFIHDKGVEFYAYSEEIEELFSETNSSYVEC